MSKTISARAMDHAAQSPRNKLALNSSIIRLAKALKVLHAIDNDDAPHLEYFIEAVRQIRAGNDSGVCPLLVAAVSAFSLHVSKSAMSDAGRRAARRAHRAARHTLHLIA